MDYDQFITEKTRRFTSHGFEPLNITAPLFEWQAHVVKWAIKNGRAALFEDCGLGKTAQQLEWASQVCRHTGGSVIILTPLSVARQTANEAAKFGIGPLGASVAGALKVDSWNNIGTYLGKQNCFFIFDEQRLVGHGAWVKNFLKIAEKNRWILLTATPGDVWLDYAPVFIANGWYKNITDFKRQHVVYAPYVKFPKVVRYLGEGRLQRLRNEILVEMPYLSHTERILNFIDVGYDRELLEKVTKHRWNPFENQPIKDVGELFRLSRMIVNSDPSRLEAVRMIMTMHPRLIIFYNFDYELDILRTLKDEISLGEWNGHRKQPIPDTEKWVYLVQYIAGAESWNCTSTNAMILYSMTYSYKNYIQAQGRIDRLNTEYVQLYYYILGSPAFIDRAVRRALDSKKSFNEGQYVKTGGKFAAAGMLDV